VHPGVQVSEQFSLLGPLEIRSAGRVIRINSPKHRILLAMLLTRPGELVSTGRLAAAIWGEQEPQNPRRAVQLCVTRLRSLLPGRPVLVTGPDGYLLRINPDQTDLGQFQSLLREADRAAAADDPVREADLLREALSIWRGEPLADVPSELLHGQVVPQLQEQWLRAVERRFAVELRLGAQTGLIGELFEATARYPLRERFWVQLMTALDRDGRRAEALAAYHAGRRQLVDELGIEPGDEMRQLHLAILGFEPGRSLRPAVPRQLPAEAPAFVGRRPELVRLTGLLSEREQPAATVVITGMAGVGKTALAKYWGRRVADRFPDGQLWVDLRAYDRRPVVAPINALRLLLRALGIADPEIPPDLDGRAALYRSAMDGRRMLVVIDNAGAADEVRPLLAGGRGTVTVVTSRDRLTGLVADGAHSLVLGMLSAEESVALVRDRLGAVCVEDSGHRAGVIAQQCGRLPLALMIASARTDQLWAGVEELTGADSATDLRTVFSWSVRKLSLPAARLLRLLAAELGPEFTVDQAAGLTDHAVGPLLEELAREHLLSRSAPERWVMHELFRTYAAG
jgi:DNA-binding SARP family transcriptional activator